MHNENKGEEMIKIMSHVHQFVPVVECEKQVEINSEMTVSKDCSKAHSLLFGGDQLTAARIRGAQEAKSNSVTLTKRFDGLIPVIEDWHTKEVCWRFAKGVLFCYTYTLFIGYLEVLFMIPIHLENMEHCIS